ncbi:MAG TPA: hypothetical protein VN496_16955 [Burkholderiales bacterium]|jgi:hypothetical protein|nr:hypothetical protein [Burkholderiales bacterium]
MRPLLIIFPGETRKWRVELANGDHAVDHASTDTARLDVMYWTQVNTPADALLYSENGDLEKLNHTK